MTTLADNPAVDEAGLAAPRSRLRAVLLVCLLCGIIGASYFLFATETGGRLVDRNELAGLGAEVRVWVQGRPVVAPLIFFTLYITCALLSLPVWWLQILAGYAYGLAVGVAMGLAGHTLGTLTALHFARWLGADFVRAKVGRNLHKFHRLTDAMGRNGLLIVLAARVCFVVPYGPSNYLFGLTGIRGRDAALGTIIGGLPVVAGWVAIGAGPAILSDWRLWAAVIASNVVLFVPLMLRKRRKSRDAAVATGVTPAAG